MNDMQWDAHASTHAKFSLGMRLWHTFFLITGLLGVPLLHLSGFPKWCRLVGDNLGKMAKNYMKITKSAFLGQNRGGDMGVQTNFLGIGGDPPSPPPLGETLLVTAAKNKIACARIPLYFFTS